MTFRNDPRWLAAQARFVAENADNETPDEAFVRRAVAAFQMFLIETGGEPANATYAEAMGSFGLLAQRPAA